MDITNNNEKASSSVLKHLRMFYDSWKTNDLKIIDTLFSPEWEDIPLAPGMSEGPEGLKQLINFFHGNFPDVEITVLDMFGTNEKIAVRAELTFLHNKEFMGISASNRNVRISLFEIHQIKKDRIVRTWHLEDWFSLLKQ